MKSRPNNIVKQIARTKSPATLNPILNTHHLQRTNVDLTAAFYPELNRLSTPDYKMRISSPDLSRDFKKPEKVIQTAKEEKHDKKQPAPKGQKIEVNAKKDEDDNTTEQSSSQHISYVTGEYQLDTYDLFSRRKNVKFEEKIQELQRSQKKRVSGQSSARNSSILKNSSKVLDRSLNSSQKSVSIQNSFTAVKKCKIGYSLGQDNVNTVVRKKYESILEQMKLRSRGESREKYIDELFPPVEASIFNNSVHRKGIISKGKDQIVWMRLSEIHPGKCKIFSKENSPELAISRGDKGYVEQYLVTALNAIKNKVDLLQFIFQKQESNPFGIYLVKIYQESTWKFVIIDDLIPCVRRRNKKEERYLPLFANVTTTGDTNIIWPYLLEKAYANYYSCYQNLTWGNPVDFVSELTGMPYQELNITNKKQAKETLEKKLSMLGTYFMSGNAIALGWSEEKNQHFPITLLKQTFTGQNILLRVHDPQKPEPIKVELSQLHNVISTVYYYNYGSYPNTATCPVYPPKHLSQKPKKMKQKQQKTKHIQIPQTDTISLRAFTIFKKTKCCVDLRQKEIRFYSQCGVTEYLWVRCLFLQKQYDGNFRWVAGRYSNQKHIIFQQNLDPGEYYLIIMVQWRQKYNKELTVALYSDCEFIKFERKNYNRQDKILELACMDLAQRYGKLNQINKSICSYTYLCEDSALIIENIVNQRTRGDVTIMRSISGLKSKVQILPLNAQFEAEGPEEYGSLEKSSKKVISQSIEIDIAKGQSFTVVLRMRGGIDRKFFKVFNFG